MNYIEIIAIVLAIAVAILLSVIIILSIKLKMNKIESDKIGKVKIIDGKRYTESETTVKNGNNVAVTHNEGDIILARGKLFKVGKNEVLLPGKYTILSGGDNADTYNIRIGGFVREYKHNADIVLAEGEEICAVSHTVILR